MADGMRSCYSGFGLLHVRREATGIAECALGLHGLELAVAGIAAGVGPTANYVGRASADLCSRSQQGQQEQQNERASLKVSSALRHRCRRSNLRRGSTLWVSGEW